MRCPMSDLAIIDPGTIVRQPTIPEVVDAWLEDPETDRPLTDDTRATYRRAVVRFLRWRDRTGAVVDGRTVREWLAELGGSPATRNLHLAALRSFCAWAVRSGYLPTDPTAGVKGAKRKGTTREHKRDALAPGEVSAMLRACSADRSVAGRRDAAIVALMAYMGLRTVEVERANVEDLGHHEGRRVLAIRGKGSAEELERGVVTLPCQRYLAEWLAARPGPQVGPLVTTIVGEPERLSRRTIRRVVKGRMAEAGVLMADRVVTTHSLRHTAITQVLRAGGSVRDAQYLARHASIETTQRYMHEVDRYANAPEDLIIYE